MKIKEAIIVLEDGTTYLYPEMELNELGYAVLRESNPRSQVIPSEETLQRWKHEAMLDFVKQPIKRSSVDCHIDLYMRMKLENYQTIERANQAQHELILAYSEKR